MVDWKKEIKLGELVGRKEDESAESAPAESTAVVTPEAPARRAEDVMPDATVEVEAAAEAKTPIWKRELRLRKPKDGDEPVVPVAPDFRAGAPTVKPAQPQNPSRYARPGTARPEPAKSDDASRGGRFARFTRPGGEAKPTPKREHAPASERPSRFARFGRQGTGNTTAEPAPESASSSERRSLFARFSRQGITDAPPKPAAEDAPRTRGRSPLAREISFRRRKSKTEAIAGGPAEPRAKHRAKKKTEVVGLKIGASHLAAAHVVSNGTVELLQVARDQLERGVVVGGELRDPEALGVALKEFFRRHKLPPKAVRLGVGTNRIGVRRLEITGLQDRSHLENAIRFRAQEVLPIPLEEAVLDYQVVGETTDEKGAVSYRVLLVVAYRDLVQRYVRACRVAGLKLVGIDLEAFALLRALGPTKETRKDDAAVVLVSIGHDRSTFVVADGDTCEFARVLDWGGGALDVAIARALERTPSQVEAIKRSLTLNTTQERLEGHTDEQASAVYAAMRKELQTFVRELVSSLHFYQNQPGSLGIGEITITGGTAQLPGLAAELQRLIGVTVRVGDPFTRVSSSKRVETGSELGSVAVAIGLGLER